MNPRTNIRTVIPPPAPPRAPTATTSGVSARGAVEGKVIGKQHGRLRSIGLLLEPAADAELRRLAAEHGITLGEVVAEALQRIEPTPARRSPGRGPRLRRGLGTAATYILLTPDEARELSHRAATEGTSVSDCATRLLARLHSSPQLPAPAGE